LGAGNDWYYAISPTPNLNTYSAGSGYYKIIIVTDDGWGSVVNYGANNCNGGGGFDPY
jgi:hypothetical protein